KNVDGPDEAKRNERIADAPPVTRQDSEREFKFLARKLPATHEVLAEELARVARSHVIEPPFDEVELLARGVPGLFGLLCEEHARFARLEDAKKSREHRLRRHSVGKIWRAGAGELVRGRPSLRNEARELGNFFDGLHSVAHVIDAIARTDGPRRETLHQAGER